MAGVYVELRDFARAHRACGELRGDVGLLERDGYRVWVTYSCGARLEHWVTPTDTEEDLLRTDLLALEN